MSACTERLLVFGTADARERALNKNILDSQDLSLAAVSDAVHGVLDIVIKPGHNGIVALSLCQIEHLLCAFSNAALSSDCNPPALESRVKFWMCCAMLRQEQSANDDAAFAALVSCMHCLLAQFTKVTPREQVFVFATIVLTSSPAIHTAGCMRLMRSFMDPLLAIHCPQKPQ